MNKQAFDQLCSSAVEKHAIFTAAMTAGGAAIGKLVGGERGATVGGATGFGATQGTYLPMLAAMLDGKSRNELLGETLIGRASARKVLQDAANGRVANTRTLQRATTVLPTATKIVLRNPRLRSLAYLGALLGGGAGGASSYYATKAAPGKTASLADDLNLRGLRQDLLSDTYRGLGASADKTTQAAKPLKIVGDRLPTVVSKQPLSRAATHIDTSRRGFLSALTAFSIADGKTRNRILRMATTKVGPAQFVAVNPHQAAVLGASAMLQQPPSLRRRGLRGLLLGGGAAGLGYLVSKAGDK
jgi:hypothetical protein